MAWQSSSINPTVTSPAADITKLTNDLAVLRSVLGGGSDGDVPVAILNPTFTNSASLISTSWFPRLSLIRSGVGAWYVGGDGAGATPNFQVSLNTNTFAQIDSSGNFALGSSAPICAFDLQKTGASTVTARLATGVSDPNFQLVISNGVAGLSADTQQALFGLQYSGSGESATIGFLRGSGVNDGRIALRTNGVSRVYISGTGEVHFPSIGTTASAANAFLNSGSSPVNQLLRSTSSRRYKQDIRDLPADKSEAIFDLRPVIYKSRADADDKGLDWYGLIAEEVAQVDPRLCHYIDLDGQQVPDGVQYDRIAVLLLAEFKALRARVDALEAEARQ